MPVRKTATIAAMSFMVLVWAMVLGRVLFDATNHVGFDVLWLVPPLLLVVSVGLWQKRERAGKVLVVLGAFSIVSVVLLRELDVLVPYEVWLKRGMPARPF